ncbi:oxidoreductase, short chain dehydrogenase/reductase family [Oleiphilus messinensis]|uniref:Oxidoreductase, short chain dehydrogenase/reductase family n=1 Tax=Oleiphilus messinensis TaxID=141451 RepID=A0A1Y0IC53_9GAMM|nr:SDR family NAD(P)-dependent oxidoreductase [Oleiphilus messinensis]ARU57045.1 oxidoreductase, short chain dehydrogenase/reductase family [Oleiphilus messinensis]
MAVQHSISLQKLFKLTPSSNVRGQTVVITGSSSGIGEVAAIQLADKGAKVCLVARREDELLRVRNSIEKRGGSAFHYPADLTQPDSLNDVVDQILNDHERVDVLVNNAARSIRRPILEALNRLHDYERTMQINYIAAVNLTLRLLPHFLENGSGQVVNISTLSTQVPIPLFSAYLASKSALESFTRSLVAELGDRGIVGTVVYFPMVRTPMSSKTAIYKHMRMMGPEKAAGWIVKAIEEQPSRVSSPVGVFGSLLLSAAPGAAIEFTRPLFKRMDKKLADKLGGERR